ncbi:MAG: hypothetical protein HKO59_13835 [Phycisphaerales bacterium]|nr:hypothetical protein [Phycisphaerae bacterium]NNF42718.1 hypothetical protein [Phycisphaerales bacterium]NNM27041.1 hypothetical protein [Phycisphaerales bacterium]
MSLPTSRTRLVAALKELHSRWSTLSPKWRDAVAKSFEEEHVAPLEGKVRASVTAMEHMHDIVSRARRECE